MRVQTGVRFAAAAGILLWTALSASAVDLMRTELQPRTLDAFSAYTKAAEKRMNDPGAPFLWADLSAERRKTAEKGGVVAEPWSGTGDFDVPEGMIHDWIGTVFIPGTTLDRTLALLQNYNGHRDLYKPEVMDSRLLGRNGDEFKIYMRLLKKKVITVVLNTEHEAHWERVSPVRARSASYSTRIAEVQNPGKPDEREMTPDTGHGFLWRLYSYWRLEQRDGGVWVECEAISLTRSIPNGLGWLVTPIVRSLPRESLANTLKATRDALAKRG